MERFIKYFFARVCPFNYIKVSHQEGKNIFVLMSTMISKEMSQQETFFENQKEKKKISTKDRQ